MTINNLFILTAIFACLLSFCLGIEQIFDNQPTLPKILEAGQTTYYSFTVQPNISLNTNHLILNAAAGGDEDSDPDLYISKTSEFPNATNSQWSCTTWGQEICVVPKSAISSGQTFYIAVYCLNKCNFKLSARLSEELEITNDIPISGNLKASESRIFMVRIPDDNEINSFSVIANLGTTNTSMVRLLMRPARTENDFPSTSFSFSGIPVWLGVGLRLYESDPKYFCRNCTFRIILSSAVETTFLISFRAIKGITKIKESWYDTYDLVKGGEKNCYEYNVKDPKETLEISLNTYSGNPDIYVHPREIPKTLEQFTFKSTGDLDEIMSISSEQRNSLNAPTGIYYVCVYGSFPASYNLMIYTSTYQITQKIPIQSGLTRTMHVKQDEMLTFEYVMKEQTINTNISISLKSLTGNADLYIKYCKSPIGAMGKEIEPCEITKNDMTSTTILKSVQTSSVDEIKTQFRPMDCKGDGIKCVYLIGVYGVMDTRFSLSVFGEDQLESPLVEGVPVFGHVGLYQFTHYVFSITDPDTQSIRVQLTSMSGDADLYISRINPMCGCLLAERSSNLDNFLQDAISFTKEKDGSLNQTYHISVHGYTDSRFSIYYTTTTEKSKIPEVWLYDGQPQMGTINIAGKQNAILYKFATSFDIEDLHPIKLILSDINGQYAIFIGADYQPTRTNYTWFFDTSYQTSLNIFANDPHYRRKAIYYVLVEHNPNIENRGNSFMIKYLSGSFITDIQESIPEMNNMTRNEFLYYRYQVTNNTAPITVTVTPLSGDPDLYISLDEKNKRPTKELADLISTSFGADSITVESSEFFTKNPVCVSSGYSSSKCGLYIGVTCASNQCSFSLTVNHKNSAGSKLIDGFPQFGKVSENNPQHFSFSPKFNSKTVISAYPQSGFIRIYANLYPITRHYDLNSANLLYPTPNQNNITGNSKANVESITIDEKLLEKCGLLCKVYISVYYTNMGRTNEISINSRSEFMIVATSKFLWLSDGMTIADSVQEKTYKFYYFTVPCNDCILSISLAALSEGDPDLFINKGTEKLPSMELSDFKSTAYRGDFLQITGSENYFINNPNDKINGTYVIGVHGFTNSTYSLTVTTSASSVQFVTLGIPTRKESKKGEINYFTFHSWKGDSIIVTLTMHSGRAILRGNVAQDIRETNILDHLPVTEAKSTWSSTRENTLNSMLINKYDSKFIDNGTYFFAVEALELSSYDIIVDYQDENFNTFIPLAEPYQIIMPKDSERRVAFIVNEKSEISINLYMNYGSISGTMALSKDGNTENIWNFNEAGLVISHTDTRFVEGTYYLTFKAKSDASFTVTVKAKNENTKLNIIKLAEGTPQSSEISQTNKAAYFYYVIPAIPDTYYGRISISVKFSEPVRDSAIYMRKIVNNDTEMPRESLFDVKIPYNQDTGTLGGTFDLKFVSYGSVAISVYGEAFKTHKFVITVWTSGIISMVPQQEYHNEIARITETHIYEIKLQKASKLFVEVIPCSGEVEFKVGKSLARINDKGYDLKKSELSKGKLYGSVDAPVGNYYVVVKGIGQPPESGGERILYNIRTITKDAKDVIDLEDFYMDNYGNIQYMLEGNEVTLSWGALKSRANDISENVDAEFKVYFSEKNNTNMFTVCGIALAKKVCETKENFCKFKMPRRSNQFQYTFNVIAKLKNLDQSVAYNPVVVQISRINSRAFRYMMLGIFILMIIFAAATIYYCRRYKKVQKQLVYEMNDARNLSHVTTEMEIPAIKAESYSHLKPRTDE